LSLFTKKEIEEIFAKAKLIAYVVQSTNPDKVKLLEELRAKMEEATTLVDKILEGEREIRMRGR